MTSFGNVKLIRYKRGNIYMYTHAHKTDLTNHHSKLWLYKVQFSPANFIHVLCIQPVFIVHFPCQKKEVSTVLLMIGSVSFLKN